MTEYFKLSATQAAAAIRAGEITSEDLVKACLDRIATQEDQVQAWAHLDRDYALQQARAADASRRAGRPQGPLHGVPVGLKDIFDTYDMPTENGTALHAGRRPAQDATVVALLRQAGAVILGKTVTTELATYFPGKTQNPHDPARTPGGSSSGSAAAVAAEMVPFALGSQTNGSVIRPAAYCGVYGFKPSHGIVSRHGVLALSRALDHVGVFARSIEDLALATQQLTAYDQNDLDMRPQAQPDLVATAGEEPPLPPRLAFVKNPVWQEARQDTQGAFAELAAYLEDSIGEVELSELFVQAVPWHRTIMETDLALSFEREYQRGKNRLSAELREMIERGLAYSALDYKRALAGIPALTKLLDQVFEEYDAILTPATTGEAPLGLSSTGSPIFCTLWTLCGMPAVSLPLLQGKEGLPLGVQLVGPKGDDARLLRTARALVAQAAGPPTVNCAQLED